MKKLLSLLLALAMVFALAACGGDGDASQGGGSQDGSQSQAGGDASQGEGSGGGVAAEGEVSVFYYTYSDTYISSVRAALDSQLESAGVEFADYDGNNNQTTQTEQVQTAIAKGSSLLVVNVVDTGSQDAAKNIIDLAADAGIPVIFFNRSVDEETVSSYDKCAFVGTDYEQAGHMQGEMIGEYLVENYDAVDLNGDGVISYVLFKGQQGNMEADARTQYSVEDANAKLTEAGKPELSFYDENNTDKYLLDQTGGWSASEATNYMQTLLSQYSEANGNMVELVIANNDDMALGSISALQAAGYNTGDGTTIPVFGVDATDAGKDAISNGSMTATVKQDAEGMANAIATITQNFLGGKDTFEGIDAEEVVGTWRVNIPYGIYSGE